jgi:3-keto-disaccharide hydrolase
MWFGAAVEHRDDAGEMMPRNSWLRPNAAAIVVALMAALMMASGSAYSTEPSQPVPAAAATPTAGVKAKVWNFDEDMPHQVASGWEAVAGPWQVLPDVSAPSHPNTFGLPPGRAFISLVHMLEYQAIALIKDPTEYSDFTFEVDFKPIKGWFDCSGGMVFRYVDAKNFYVLAVGCPTDYFQLIRMFKGKSELLQQKIVPTDQNTWYKIKLIASGDRFLAYDNNKLVFDATDSKIAKGRLGLWAGNDSQARFDNVTLTLPVATSAGGAGTGETTTEVPEELPPPPPPLPSPP